LKGIQHGNRSSLRPSQKNGKSDDTYDLQNSNKEEEDQEIWAAQHIVSQVRVEIDGEIIMIENMSYITVNLH